MKKSDQDLLISIWLPGTVLRQSRSVIKPTVSLGNDTTTDKLKRNYASMVALMSGFLWLPM